MTATSLWSLELGVWDLFGIWVLGFGVSNLGFRCALCIRARALRSARLTPTFCACYYAKNFLTPCHDLLAAWFPLAGISGRFGISPGRDPGWNFVCRHSPGSLAGAAPGTIAQAPADGGGSKKSDAGLGPGTVYRVRAYLGSF